ncbi:MAG: hypothetical protein ACXVC1_06130, partial [Tumebacillaceae bacterium]
YSFLNCTVSYKKAKYAIRTAPGDFYLLDLTHIIYYQRFSKGGPGMDAVDFVTYMWLYFVGLIFIIVALFETVLKSKPK